MERPAGQQGNILISNDLRTIDNRGRRRTLHGALLSQEKINSCFWGLSVAPKVTNCQNLKLSAIHYQEWLD